MRELFSQKTALKIQVLLLLPCLLFWQAAAWALPTGYQPVAGNVTFSGDNQTLNVISGSHRSIVNYQSFNIGSGETVNFRLPGSSSVILNRVLGGDPSSIFGRLNSNGQVFLVNPNGILFGPGAQVNVGSLFASTLGISDEDFMGGRLAFQQDASRPAASIVNQGRMQIEPGGYGVLAAAAIRNEGEIIAPQGQVHLAVGQRVTLKTDDFLGVEVTVDEPLRRQVETLQTAIENSGTLRADDGLVRLQVNLTENLYEKAINNTGLIAAKGVVKQGGVVEFIADGPQSLIENHGTVDVSGSLDMPDGGQVAMRGGDIMQAGMISANAAEGGKAGQIDLRAVDTLRLGSGSRTEAQAADLRGSGGRIIVWSDRFTDLSEGASVNADAGLLDGHGGFIELSSQDVVRLGGNLSAAGYAGQAGTILIDPTNVRITNLSLNGGSAGIPHTDPNNAGGESTFDPASFVGFANVNIEATNDITIESPFALNNVTAGNNLTLRAGNDITIQEALSTNGGHINLIADADLSATGGPVSNGAGSITVTGTGSIASNNGNITLQGAGMDISGLVDAGNGRVILNSTGDVTVDGLAGSGKFLSTRAAGAAGSESIVLDIDGQLNLLGGAANQSGAVVASNGNIRVSGNGVRLNLTGGNGTESGSLITGSNFVFQGDAIQLLGGTGARSGGILAGGNVSISAVGIPFQGVGGMLFDDAGSNVFTPCGDDCNSGLINFGFNFDFFGNSISGGQIITNGFLWMGNNAATPFLFSNLPVSEATGKIALFQADLNPDLGGSIGYNATGSEFFVTFRDVSDVNGAGVLNGQIGLLSTGNSLGLRQGTIVLSYGDTLTTPYNTTPTGIGLNAGNGTGFATLNSLGIGSANGRVTDVQLAGLAGRSFAFTPDGAGNYTVTELFHGTGGGISATGGAGLFSGSIISSNGNINLNTNGDVTLSGGGSVLANGANRTINILSGGVLSVSGGSSIGSNGGQISLESLGIDIGGTLDAGTGTIVLNPFDGVDVKLADNADGDGDDAVYDLNAAELGQITAGTLQVGSTGKTGDLILSGDLDVSGVGPAGAYNLDLRTGGDYIGTGQTVTLGNRALTVTTLGTVDTGAVSGNNADVSFSAGDTLTVNDILAVNGTGTIALATTSNDNIVLGANVGGGQTTTITAHGTGTIIQTGGTVSGTTVSLSSGTGDIGVDALNPIVTDAGTVRVNTGGSAYASGVGALNLGASTVGDTLHAVNAFNITTSGAISADNLILETTAPGNTITLGSNVTGSTSILLDADSHITRIAGRVLGGALTVQSASGNISLHTDVNSVEGNVFGHITLNELGSFSIGAGNLSAGGNISLTAGGNVVTVGEISGANVGIVTGGSILDGNGNANDLTATAGASLRAEGIIGTLANPFEVTVSGGQLRVSALDHLGFVSAVINGSVAPVDILTMLNRPPGDVYYNGQKLVFGKLVERVANSLAAMNRIGQPYMAVIGRKPSTRIYLENRQVESYLIHEGSPKLIDSPLTRRVNLPISGALLLN